jgi:hypothetical protein
MKKALSNRHPIHLQLYLPTYTRTDVLDGRLINVRTYLHHYVSICLGKAAHAASPYRRVPVCPSPQVKEEATQERRRESNCHIATSPVAEKMSHAFAGEKLALTLLTLLPSESASEKRRNDALLRRSCRLGHDFSIKRLYIIISKDTNYIQPLQQRTTLMTHS